MSLIHNNPNMNNPNMAGNLMQILQLPPDQLAHLTATMEKSQINSVCLIKPIFLMFFYQSSTFSSYDNVKSSSFLDERSSPELIPNISSILITRKSDKYHSVVDYLLKIARISFSHIYPKIALKSPN